MSDKSNKIEIDAHPFTVDKVDKRRDSEPSEESETNLVQARNNGNAVGAMSVYANNMLVNNQTAVSTNLLLNECSHITFGNLLWPHSGNTVAEVPQEIEENIVYRKTPTIKTMMESDQRLNDKYLDIFCAKLGHKFQAVSVHLKIDELDVQQAIEDHRQYGTSEVLFQILSKYFQVHDQFATVGYLTRFLWKNNYKQNVWAVKELWKLLRELDEDAS